MLQLPEMKILFSILLFAAALFHCTVGNVGGVDRRDLPCREEGFFPVPGSCEDYYECQIWEGNFHRVHARCPPGRIFDNVYRECRSKLDALSPAHCLKDASAPGVFEAADVAVSITDAVDSSVIDVNEEEGDVSDNQISLLAAETLPTNVTAEVEEAPGVPTISNVTENGTRILEDDTEVVADVNVTLSSGTIDANGTKTIVLAEEITICDHLGIVNSYATLVLSRPALQESFEYLEKYNKNVMKYNRHLEKAQNNTLIWRNGESILSGLKRTYAQASIYEMEFNRKYAIYQDRVKTVSNQKQNNNERFVQKLKDDIKKLQEEIKGNEQILSMTDVPQVQEYFENNIISKRQEIERKQQELKANTEAGLLLEELLQFLEYVKGDANEVENLAMHSKDRMEMFNENLKEDYASFEKYATVAKEDIQALSEEEEQNEQSLIHNREEQLRLEDKKDDIDAEINMYNEANEKNMKAISKLSEEMEEKINIFNQKSDFLCMKNGIIKEITDQINANSTEINANSTKIKIAQLCNAILESNNVTLELSEERVRTQQLLDNSTRNREQITYLLSQLTVMDQDMRNFLSAVPTYRSRLQQIDVELRSLQMYYGDLENLQFGLTSTMESLLEIMEEFQEMQSSFEFITKQFNILIAQGNAAETDEDRQREKLAIEQHISDVPQQLEELVLPELGKCT